MLLFDAIAFDVDEGEEEDPIEEEAVFDPPFDGEEEDVDDADDEIPE